MTVYGDFDNRFRPRPPASRLALVSFCHFVIAVSVANGLVSAADMAVWHTARVEKAWIVYLPPWTTLKSEALRRIAPLAQAEFLRLGAYFTGALVLLGIIILFLWPGRQTMAGRLFSIRLAQCVALFGAGFPLRRKADLSWPVLIELAAAGWVVAAGEWQANTILAQVLDLRRAVLRLGQWSVRVLPGAVTIAVASYVAAERIVLYLAIVFAAIACVANFIRRPMARYQRIDNPELRGAGAISLAVAVAIVSGCVWAFGFLPVRSPRVVVVSTGAPHIETWDTLLRELAEPPKIDLHWTTPAERAHQKKEQ